MKLNNVSFPYPVLGINDDILPGLTEESAVIELNRDDPKDYILSIRLQMNNPCISDLIHQGYAQYVCEINCIKTNLRRAASYSEPEFKIHIDRRGVSGNVDVNCFVTIIKPINNYINPGFNEDYNGTVFNLSEGDILVGFPSCSFVADKKFDKLKSAVAFMQIRQDKDKSYTNFEFTPKTIDIKLPTELFNIFNSGVGTSYAEIIHSSFAYSALLVALHEINKYSSHQWAQAIVELVRNHPNLTDGVDYEIDDDGIHFTDKAHIAMMLLKDPYDRMLRKLESINQPTSMFDYE